MNLPICVNRLYWVSSKIVAYVYLLAGLFNSVQCTKNVLKRQKRDTVKSSVFSMDSDRSILHLHGNTVCCHLPVISCIVLVRWLLCVMLVVWFNMSTSGHIVLLVFVLSCCMPKRGPTTNFARTQLHGFILLV